MPSTPPPHHNLCRPGHRPSSQAFDQEYKQYGMFDETGKYLGPQAGCTACVALLRGSQLHVASVGDTR
jgi:serine/threonine protein phosphatase PrpC